MALSESKDVSNDNYSLSDIIEQNPNLGTCNLVMKFIALKAKNRFGSYTDFSKLLKSYPGKNYSAAAFHNFERGYQGVESVGLNRASNAVKALGYEDVIDFCKKEKIEYALKENSLKKVAFIPLKIDGVEYITPNSRDIEKHELDKTISKKNYSLFIDYINSAGNNGKTKPMYFVQLHCNIDNEQVFVGRVHATSAKVALKRIAGLDNFLSTTEHKNNLSHYKNLLDIWKNREVGNKYLNR